mgnify:FL=1
MSKNYYTYVLRCADGTLYCGFTDNVEKRLATHNAAKGAKYTKTRLPVTLVSTVKFSDKSSATKCEWWFKHKLTRQKKLQLIQDDMIRETFEKFQARKTK